MLTEDLVADETWLIDHANHKPSIGLIALRMKERWEAGPPRCLLRRVGLVPTSVNFEGLTEWVWRPPAGGQKAEARQRSHRHPYLPRCLGDLGTDGSCSTYRLEEVRLRDDRLLQEQMLTIYTHLGMLSRGKFPLSPRGRGQGEGVPLLRLDAETHLAIFS